MKRKIPFTIAWLKILAAGPTLIIPSESSGSVLFSLACKRDAHNLVKTFLF